MCEGVGRQVRIDDTEVGETRQNKNMQKQKGTKMARNGVYVGENALNYIYCSAQLDLFHVSNISYIN